MSIQYDSHIGKPCSKSSGVPTDQIKNGATIFVCSTCVFHYVDYLDDLDSAALRLDEPDRKHFTYIRNVLQFSGQRYVSRLDLVGRYRQIRGARCLDIGAGGGLFQHLMPERGAETHGIELDRACALFAREECGRDFSSKPIEGRFWQGGFAGYFDVVTLWDVIEHVNLQLQILAAAVAVLNPGEMLGLDTPVRDRFLHNLAELSYRLSRGRAVQLLNLEYSSPPFARKQIFASRDWWRS